MGDNMVGPGRKNRPGCVSIRGGRGVGGSRGHQDNAGRGETRFFSIRLTGGGDLSLVENRTEFAVIGTTR